MKIFWINPTINCPKFCFNGSLIVWNLSNIDSDNWNNCVKIPKASILVNIYRACDNENRDESKIMLQFIDYYGNSLIPSKTIYDSGIREDPRIFVWKKALYISYSFLILNKKSQKHIGQSTCIRGVKIKYCKLNDFMPKKEVQIDYGYNSEKFLDEYKFWEKNWLFFPYFDKLFVIYSLNPLIIIDSQTCKRKVYHEWVHRQNKIWKNFEIRGGASPILVKDQYYIFAHTHHNLMKPNYKMILLVLDLNLNLIGCTDPIYLPIKNKIVYPSGAIYLSHENMFLITCGIDDEKQALIHISKNEIDNLIITL